VVAATVASTLAIQLVLTSTGGADANSGVVDPTVGLEVRFARLFSYFTVLSNILVGVTSVMLAIRPQRDSAVWRVVRLDALLGIIATGVVFHLLLAPILDLAGWAYVATLGFHYATPILAVAVWLIFGPRPTMSASTLAWACLWPAAWLLFTFVRGEATGWYPYPFLDAGKLGLATALINSGLVLVGAAVVAAVLLLVDRLLPAPLRPQPDSPTPARVRSAG